MPYLRALLLTTLATAPLSAGEPVRFPAHGVKLPGPQLLYDAGFEVADWDGDGRTDLLLPNTGMMAFAVHLNEGTRDRPRFGHAVPYPVNLTETEPQTIEHCQAMAVGDLTGDGLWDLVCFDGQLRLVPNTGTPRGPNHWHLHRQPPHFFPGSDAMIRENARFSTGPESMYWNKGVFARQVLTLTLADWDGDGLLDLLVCRFKGEAPGVAPTGGAVQWTGWGRVLVGRPQSPPPKDARYLTGPLAEAPARGLYFYRNVGTKEKPWFDKGTEVRTPDGRSVAAPNPVVADLDGDGTPDVLSCETRYSCNAFRVDWPTEPAVVWFRRPKATDPATVESARPLADAAGRPVPAGVQARFADIRGAGVRDLLVMDAELKGSIRWYRNTAGPAARPAFAPAEVLTGTDFLRFDFMCQPVVANWFGPASRDLILHGCTDSHCKWSLRRTALYRNAAGRPGEVRYEFAGHLTYRGNPAMVPPAFEERPYDCYGSAVALFPDRRLLMSVDGKLYLFSDLAPDGRTYRARRRIDLPANRNRHTGWQEIPVRVPEPVKFIRIGNDRNGMGNLRDSFLHVVRFHALDESGADRAAGAAVADTNTEPSAHYRVQRPGKMFDPKNAPGAAEPNFTTFGYYIGPAVVTLKEPAHLKTIRFQLSDREARWYDFRLPFYWQGKLLRDGTEAGEPWYQYKVEVSADGKTWTTVADAMRTEMMRSHPCLVDWDRDGKTDLFLGVLNSNGIWPADKEYRLYRNRGTEAEPVYGPDFEPVCDEAGKPLKLPAHWYLAYAPQCGVAAPDLDGDGKPELVVEGFQNSELEHYQPVAGPGLRVRKAGLLGSPRPIRYPTAYRYFAVADADGDGTPDLLNSVNANVALFRGVPPGAPLPADPPPAVPAGSLVLRNGPADGPHTPAYSGAEACTLDAQTPAEVVPRTPPALTARAQVERGEKQKVVLVRFRDIPKDTPAGRAYLELTTDPGLQEDPGLLQGMATLAVSCSAIRNDWDAARATFAAAAPGKPWAAKELDAGGTFQSFARPELTVRERRTLRWDVTAAVRDARRAGAAVSLLVRVEYTGPYVAGHGYRFWGPDHPAVEHRPRLVLTPE